MRARRGRFVEMERLRIEAPRERLDVVGGEGVAAELGALADRDVLEELHDAACVRRSRRPSISDVVKRHHALARGIEQLELEAARSPCRAGSWRRGFRARSRAASARRRDGSAQATAPRRRPARPSSSSCRTKASTHIRIRMQQACQPDAASPPSMVARAASSSRCIGCGIEFGRERDDLVARQAARAVLEHAARREVFPLKLRHGGSRFRRDVSCR